MAKRKEQEKRVLVGVRLPADLAKALKMIAAFRGISVQALVESFLREHIPTAKQLAADLAGIEPFKLTDLKMIVPFKRTHARGKRRSR